MSGSEFYEWLFGPVKFSGLLRNARLGSVCKETCSWDLEFVWRTVNASFTFLGLCLL